MRIVITGSSAITSIGIGTDVFWSNIKKGISGIKTITKFDCSKISCSVGAEVEGFNPNDYLDRKESKKMDRFVQYAAAASLLAIKNANLNLDDVDRDLLGVMIGTGIGGINTFESCVKTYFDKGPDRVSPFFIPMLISNMATGQVAILTGARGINLTAVSACASGADAIGQAFLALKRNDAEVIITGGTESSLSLLPFVGFAAMKAMSLKTDPQRACCPFDKDRDGFVMGEGAGILILETLEHAKKRGANILAEIVGYASTNDAYHITAPLPSGRGAADCMKKAIKNAQIELSDVDYINAHGTSTPYNDKIETSAIKQVFGELAYKIPVSSTKSMTGHLLGAAGAIESVIAACSLNEGFLPPTINYENPDEECDLDYVPNFGRKANLNYAISNSFGFGGHNACLVFKKYD